MNLESLYEITSSGIPKNLTILSKKSFAIVEALSTPPDTKKGISLQYLVNLSMQVKLELYHNKEADL